MDVKGRVVVVSGGASGLGEACCRLLSEQGAKIGILDLAEDRGEQLAKDLGDSAVFHKTDVSDTDNVMESINKIAEQFGTIHVAINCAGVPFASRVLTKDGPISMDHFNKVIQINLNGSMNVIRAAAVHMAKGKNPNEDGENGVVINCSSGAAYEGQIGQAAYSASKAALVGMTLPIAREFTKYGIRVMTIAPGLFETPMVSGLPDNVQQSLISVIPFPKRMGKAKEFAMLCQQIIENPMLNGRTIRLDAAYTMGAK